MFNTIRIRSNLICAVTGLFVTGSAMASNHRSWVSHNGSDKNDCTISKPCLTFQRAHDQTLDGGEVDVLDPGDYGGLTIDHSITIDGGNMAYVVSFFGN